MPRTTREEKVMLHAQATMEDLEKLYNHDGRAVIEYNYLFKEYQKLAKRSNKIIGMNDNIGMDMLNTTEKLKENVDYTVKIAKKKILYNIEEHRKTKEVLAQHSEKDREIINHYKRELRDLRQYVSKLEHDLNINDEVNHQFEDFADPQVKSKDINSPEIKHLSFQSIVKKQIDFTNHTKQPFVLLKLTIDDFTSKAAILHDAGSDKNTIIKGLHKFFTVTVGSKNIVYYYTDNIFYLIFPNYNIEDIQSILSKLKVSRKLSEVVFTFSIGIAQWQENDNFDTLHARVQSAHIEASKDIVQSSSSIA